MMSNCSRQMSTRWSFPGTFVPIVERIKGPPGLLGNGDFTLKFMDDIFELEEEDGWFYPSDGVTNEP